MLPSFTSVVTLIPRHRQSHRSAQIPNRCSRARCCTTSASNVRSKLPLRTVAKLSEHNFSWEEQWYAVALSVDVVSEAYPIRLFASDYVLLRDSSGSIQAYHREVAISSAAVVELIGVVWLWPGDAANTDPQRVPLPIWLRSADTKGRVLLSMARTVPVSFESLVENLVDAQHVHFAHHGAMRGWNRNSPVARSGGGALVPPDDHLGTSPPGSFDALFAKTRVIFRLSYKSFIPCLPSLTLTPFAPGTLSPTRRYLAR